MGFSPRDWFCIRPLGSGRRYVLLSARFLSYENKGSEINFTSLIAEAGEVNMGWNTIEYEKALWHIASAIASKAL